MEEYPIYNKECPNEMRFDFWFAQRRRGFFDRIYRIIRIDRISIATVFLSHKDTKGTKDGIISNIQVECALGPFCGVVRVLTRRK